MIDFDAIWRFQDEVRTVVNACLGDCIWDLNYNPGRQSIEMELERHLDDEGLFSKALFFCNRSGCNL